MLQEKEKKISPDCIKLWIIIFIIIASFLWAIFLLIFLYFYFTYEKTKRKIKVLNLRDLLEIAGVHGCINHLLSKINPRNREKIEWKFKEYKTRSKNRYPKRVENSINTYEKSKVEVKNEKDLNAFRDIIENLSKKKESEYVKNNVVKDKESYSNKTTNVNNKTKNKYNSFNSWKSVWDDYESVLDIMNKKK